MKLLSQALFAVLAVLFSTVQPAYAGDPCAADVQRLCRHSRSGQETVACLAQNEGRLSPACQELRRGAREHTRQQWGGAMTACRSEIGSFCSDSGPDTGGVIGCLRQNKSRLSAGCRAALRQ